MTILARIRNREMVDETEYKRQMKILKSALTKTTLSDTHEIEEENYMISDMNQMLVDTYIRSSTRLIIEFIKSDCVVKRGYYFYDDIIVMLNAYSEGGELMWLPSIKLMIGSITEMINDQSIECDDEQFEGEFFADCNGEYILDQIYNSLSEEKYRQLLKEDKSKFCHLCVNGSSDSENEKSFVYVIFKDKSAFYYRQEENYLYYGSAKRSTLVNILGDWALRQHRNLIMKMENEKKGAY